MILKSIRTSFSIMQDINISPELARVDGVGDLDILEARSLPCVFGSNLISLQPGLDICNRHRKCLQQQRALKSPVKLGKKVRGKHAKLEYVLKYPGHYTTPEEYSNIDENQLLMGNLLDKDVVDVSLGSEVYDIYSTLNGHPSAAITLKQAWWTRDKLSERQRKQWLIFKRHAKGHALWGWLRHQ